MGPVSLDLHVLNHSFTKLMGQESMLNFNFLKIDLSEKAPVESWWLVIIKRIWHIYTGVI